jgi:hypothetical protein
MSKPTKWELRPVRVRRWLTGDILIPKDAPRKHKIDFIRLRAKTAKAARSVRQQWHVNSGYRSYAEQAQLYALYLSGKGNLAAKPGSSNHNKGRALDVSAPDGRPVGATLRRVRALSKFGLCLPVANEAWHVEERR